MPESLLAAAAPGKGDKHSQSPHVVGENSENPHTLRELAAEVTQRATWRITKIAAASLGLQDSTVQNWTCGERRSPVESVYLMTERALREGLPREKALSMVAWLANQWLTPDELEEMAADKTTDLQGCGYSLRTAARSAESVQDEIVQRGIPRGNGEVLSIRRELRRAQLALHEIERELDRPLAFGLLSGDGATPKVEARGGTPRASEERS